YSGETGERSTTGVFRTGQNPVVDVEVPATMTEGWLWVLVVDNTGKVFHILPNAYNEEQRIGELGEVDGDVRRIRVLWSVPEVQEDATRLAVQVTEGDYGKSEVIAVLSENPLFDMRRPRDESVPSVAEALGEAVEGREDEILGLAARIIDARP
ncbi:MAG: serine/threonine protein kinase, partial [Pseudomonadota bacterium]